MVTQGAKIKAKRKYWCILGWISFEDRKGEVFGLKGTVSPD
jgi:hypothetical protein